jgi:hypothetical protein
MRVVPARRASESGTGGAGCCTSTCRAFSGDFTGDASTAGRGVRSRAGASAFRGGNGFRKPPPPPPPPGPGVMRNTSRGTGSRAGALSGAPEVSHNIVTMNAPWTSEDANEEGPCGEPLTRSRFVVVKISASGSLDGADAGRHQASRLDSGANCARAARRKQCLGGVGPIRRQSPRRQRLAGTPAARAISSTVNTSERTDIGVVQTKANPLPHHPRRFRPDLSFATANTSPDAVSVGSHRPRRPTGL